jgi:hypothetical protein
MWRQILSQFLQDPDPENTWDEAIVIYATNLEEARSNAEAIAQYQTQEEYDSNMYWMRQDDKGRSPKAGTLLMHFKD